LIDLHCPDCFITLGWALRQGEPCARPVYFVDGTCIIDYDRARITLRRLNLITFTWGGNLRKVREESIMPLTHLEKFKVRYTECDQYGHVNNANYLRYMQEAAFGASADAGYDFARYDE
jgi:Acyl-ACP thioesterase